MMAKSFDEQLFEQKLVSLKDTQEAINALSSWCLQHKEHHKKIVTCWLHCLKRVKIDLRLSLFYLANDVIQYSKRKHLDDFVESWGTALQRATPLVRDDKVRQRIHRIFKIWEERGVYDEAFITDLCGLLSTTVKKKSEPTEAIAEPADFQPSALVRKIKAIKVLAENTDIKYKRIKDNKLPLTDAESMRLSLKDRRHGSDVAAEVESGVKKMEAFVKALENEISAREKLVELLRQATLFYETQRGEAKIVANAYRNFGGRLKARQKALDELMTTFVSPLPSPDINAPSPSPDSELEASIAPRTIDTQNSQVAYTGETPVVNGSDLDFSLVNSSFIGSSSFLDLSKEVFGHEPAEPEQTAEAQPIEVIGGRDAGGGGFDVAEFFKSLMPPKETVLPPPPMPPVFGDWGAAGPWDQPPAETPQSPPMYEKQVPHVEPVEYDDSLPVPPVADVDHRSLLGVQGPPQDLPPMDIDTRTRPPPVSHGPPPIMSVDIDHRGPLGMGLHGMDVPPPALPDLGVLMAPPPPVGMRGPPPPPSAVKALLDIDQRNLISLTGSPGNTVVIEGFQSRSESYSQPNIDGYRKDDVYSHTEPVYPPRQWNPLRSSDLRDADPRIKDNVESIDMDVSEEDDEESQVRAGDQSDVRQFHGPPMGMEPHLRGHDMGARIFGGSDTFLGHQVENESPSCVTEPPMHTSSLNQRLLALQSAGAKLVAPIDQQSPDKNGYIDNGDFGRESTPRPRWQSPHPPRGVRPSRPNFRYRSPTPFRGQPRHFRPRGRW